MRWLELADEYARRVRWSALGTGPEEYNCYEFARLVARERFSLDLPGYFGDYHPASDASYNSSLIGHRLEERRLWEEVPKGSYREGDVAHLWIGEQSSHVGIMVSGDRFIHLSEKMGVMLQSVSRRGVRVQGVYRFVGNLEEQ